VCRYDGSVRHERLPFRGVGIAAAHAVGGTDWDALTAVGTMALALVTLVAVVATIVITRQDRTRADAQLDRQLKASDAQLRDAREHARCEQQQADAWAVEVRFSTEQAGSQADMSAKRLGAVVRNRSARTVKWLECWFSPDGASVIQAGSMGYLLPSGRPDLLTDMSGYEKSLVPGAGVEFDSDPVPGAQATAPYPIVRWTDMQGQRWEHKRGEVYRVRADAPLGL
jgi:hypothetical protein